MASPLRGTTAEPPAWLHEQPGGVLVDVWVAPRASRTRIVDVRDNRLKIQVAAPPVDNKANAVLVRFIADLLGVSKAQIEIVGGPTSRRKTIRICDVPAHRVSIQLTPHKD